MHRGETTMPTAITYFILRKKLWPLRLPGRGDWEQRVVSLRVETSPEW